MKQLTRFRSQFKMNEKFILRDFLAIERTTLANERTLFSYVRSGLYLSLAGIAILQLEGFETIKWLAYVLFALSLFLSFFGLVRYQILQKKLNTLYKDLAKQQVSGDKI